MNRVVLVIDDDQAFRVSAAESLTHEGFLAVCVENGLDALEYLRQTTEPPCLIFLDLLMPVMDGWQFLKERMGDPLLAPIPVVVLTASAHLDSEGTGFVEVVRKPIGIDDLLDAAERWCPDFC